MWYKNLNISFFRFVTMHAFDRQTDGRTDRRTEISSLRPRCIPCSAVKNDDCLLLCTCMLVLQITLLMVSIRLKERHQRRFVNVMSIYVVADYHRMYQGLVRSCFPSPPIARHHLVAMMFVWVCVYLCFFFVSYCIVVVSLWARWGGPYGIET